MNTACIKERNGFLYLYYSKNRKFFRRSTGIKASEKKQYQNQLDTLFNQFQSVILKYFSEFGVYPTVAELEKRYVVYKNIKETLFSLGETYIQTLDIKPKTIENYYHQIKLFKEYEEKYPVDLNRIDEEFVKDFQNFLFNIKRTRYTTTYINGTPFKSKSLEGLSDNYSQSILQKLKVIIDFNVNKGTIRKYNIDWKSIYKKSPYEKLPKETFTETELKFLVSKRGFFKNYHKDFDSCPRCGSTELRFYDKFNRCNNCDKQFTNSDNKTKELFKGYDKCLDLLLFQCFTSFRFSDAIRDMKELIQDDILHLKAEKTKYNINIPIGGTLVKQLLEDNNYHFEVPSLQYYNRSIKSILKYFSNEMPSFAMMRQKIRIVNRIEQIEMVPRFMLFASHSFRRSMVTISKNNGVPDNEIMMQTGHISLSSFQGYYNTRPINDKNKNIMEQILNGEIKNEDSKNKYLLDAKLSLD